MKASGKVRDNEVRAHAPAAEPALERTASPADLELTADIELAAALAAIRAPTRSASLLLEVCAPYRMLAGSLHVERQAHQGIQRWLENFERITLCAMHIPEHLVDPTMEWTSAEDLPSRLALQPMPWSFHIRDHVKNIRAMRGLFRSLIAQHTHLCFSTLGWLGCWGSVACEEAYKLGRPYAVWLDWVLHEMPPYRPASSRAKLAWQRVQSFMLKRRSLRDVRRASLGLYNGQSVYDGYAPFSRVAKLVHNVHLSTKDLVPRAHLAKRLATTTGPFNIICVGRVHEIKGPRQWLDAMERLLREWRGTREIHATWLGAGPLLQEMQAAVATRNLSAHIRFPGQETNRERLLETLRDAHVFAFCNLTPESPRSLIEALMCGLPIVGFDNAFATGLLGPHTAGGAFVRPGDSAALAGVLARALSDPHNLRQMTEAAAAAGTQFSEEKVFKHRSDLIKRHL